MKLTKGDWLIFDDCGVHHAAKIVGYRSPSPRDRTLNVLVKGQRRRIYKEQVRLHGEALAREVIRLKEEKTA
jgi:hypothetical protein